MSVQQQSILSNEDYVFRNHQTEALERKVLELAKTIPDFAHVQEGDFQCIVALRKRGGLNNPHTIAECSYVRPLYYQMMKAFGVPLGPYLITFFPPFFQQAEADQIKTIIHEMKHIKDKKKGLNPHWGFSDEAVTEMYEKHKHVIGPK